MKMGMRLDRIPIEKHLLCARVAKLVDAGELDSPVLRDVQVRILSRAHPHINDFKYRFIFRLERGT